MHDAGSTCPSECEEEAHRGDEGVVCASTGKGTGEGKRISTVRAVGSALTGRDEAEAAGGNLVDALCKANNALLEFKDMGHKYSKAGVTLRQILRRVALDVYGKDKEVIGVYKLTNTVNGKAYVGKSVDVYQRWMGHKSAIKTKPANEGCRLLVNAARKHGGWEAFRKEILWVGEADALNAVELGMIAKHDTIAPGGYNITAGGEATPFIEPGVRVRANASKVALWDARFKDKVSEMTGEEAARQLRKRDARLRAKHRYKAKKRGEYVEPISKEAANKRRLEAANGEYASVLRKNTYARKREVKRTGNLRANCANKQGET